MSAIKAFDVPGYVLDALDELHRQRDSARRWAVHQEQEATELNRRVTVALMLLDEASCECRGAQRNPSLVCIKHQIEDALRMGTSR